MINEILQWIGIAYLIWATCHLGSAIKAVLQILNKE